VPHGYRSTRRRESHPLDKALARKTVVQLDMLTPALPDSLGVCEMRIVAGVDCHKSSHTVVFLNEIGVTCGQLTFKTTDTGYGYALEAAKELGCREWGLEGSGCYGYAFAVYVAAGDGAVYDVPGLLTQRHRKHSTSRSKSDVNDARAIAEVVLRESHKLARFSHSVVQRALRMRYDQRDRLVRDRTKAANRLRGAALLIGVNALPTDITPSRTVRRLASSARELRAAVTVDDALSAILDEIEDACESILRLNLRIKSIERVIAPLVRRVAPQLLTVFGISDISAAGIIGHAGDIRNCRSAAAFANKCGAAPVDCSSGRSLAVRLNVGGDRQLNRLLHTAAMSQVRCRDHEGRKYYDRKRSEGKTHLAAMRCLKRTLATVVFFRLRDAKGGGTEHQPPQVAA